jgi:hypothetical protein
MYKQLVATRSSVHRLVWLGGHATAHDLMRFLGEQDGKCSQSVKLLALSFCHFPYMFFFFSVGPGG